MRVTGYPGLVEQRPRIVWRKGRGFVTVRSWKGLDAGARALAQLAISDGAAQEVELVPSNGTGVAAVSASFGGSDEQTEPEQQLETNWELDEQDAMSDLWNHPKVLALLGAYSVEDLSNIRRVTNALIAGSFVDSKDDPAFALAIGMLESVTDFQQFCQRQLKENGQANYYAPTVILRQTQVGPQNWRYSYDWTQRAKLITSAEIQASEPSLWFDLPPDLWWIIRQPRITQMSNGNLQVVREWYEVEQDTWKYDRATVIT